MPISKAIFNNYALLTDADFTDSIITNANFSTAVGFTKKQLYSTASYKNKDLRGINLSYKDVLGWNFSDQNLTGAKLEGISVNTNTNFTGADLRNVRFS